MIDLPCPHCGEPWDNDELHDSPYITYQDAFKLFKRFGCTAMEMVYNGEQPAARCSRSPEYSEEFMDIIRGGWDFANYAEDVAMFMDMAESLEASGDLW